MDRFIDAGTNVVSDLHIFRREPTPHPMRLKIRMQAMGQRLVLAGVADEDRMVLNRQHCCTAPSIDLFIGQANSAQKMQGTAILRQLNGGQVNSRWTFMEDLCQSLCWAEVDAQEGC